MSTAIDSLEKTVGAAVVTIADLRAQVTRLEKELATLREAPRAAAAVQAPTACDPLAAEELKRLRSERIVMRQRIQELLAEIDRVFR